MFFNEKKMKTKMDLESQTLALLDNFPFSNFSTFLWLCWFFGKNIFNFFYPHLKTRQPVLPYYSTCPFRFANHLRVLRIKLHNNYCLLESWSVGQTPHSFFLLFYSLWVKGYCTHWICYRNLLSAGAERAFWTMTYSSPCSNLRILDQVIWGWCFPGSEWPKD